MASDNTYINKLTYTFSKVSSDLTVIRLRENLKKDSSNFSYKKTVIEIRFWLALRNIPPVFTQTNLLFDRKKKID